MEFWIDVGGTFTDCIALLDDQPARRLKVLSSGVTKGGAAADSNRRQIVDPARRADPDRFWNGYALRLLDREGQFAGESQVAHFDAASGSLQLASPLSLDPSPGQSYELSSGE